MTSPRWVSWAAVAAIVGGAMAIALTPPFAIAYYAAYPGFDVLPPWVGALRPTLAAFLSFDTPVAVYNVYGRVYDVVYLLFLPAAFALHHLHRHAKARLERWGFGILVVGLTACFVGVAGDYWLDGAGFMIEFLGLLILAIGATVFGIAMLRGNVLTGWCAWSLVVCGPATFVSFALIGHVPSGPTLPFAICWLMVGCLLLSGNAGSLRLRRIQHPPETTKLGAKQA